MSSDALVYTISGARQAARAYDRVSRRLFGDLERTGGQVHARMGRDIGRNLRGRVLGVRTGRLSGALRSQHRRRTLRWAIRDDVYYGYFWEAGFTHYRSGRFMRRPWAEPAVDQWGPEFMREVRGVLDDLLAWRSSA